MADHDRQIRLRGRYALLLSGVLKIEDLDDEELARGQLRSADGTWRGRPPMVIPTEMVQAMRREWLKRAEDTLRGALLDKGIGVLTELAGNAAVEPSVRLRAAEKIIERTMGKVPERIEVAAEDPVESLFRAILNDPEGLAGGDYVPHEPSAEERALLG